MQLFSFPIPAATLSMPAFLQLWFWWGFNSQLCYWDYSCERPPHHNTFLPCLKCHWYLKNKHLFQNFFQIVSNNCCYSLKDQHYHPHVRTSQGWPRQTPEKQGVFPFDSNIFSATVPFLPPPSSLGQYLFILQLRFIFQTTRSENSFR